MGTFLTALILAAGAATFVYIQMGKRIGYGNPAGVWKLTGLTFVGALIIFYLLFTTFISLN
jgi:hypothetical protein